MNQIWREWIKSVGSESEGGRSEGICNVSWDSIHWLTRNCGNVEHLVQQGLLRDWLGVGDSRSWDDAVQRVCSTQCILYSVYAIVGVCYTRCMVYSVDGILGVWYTRCMEYWVYGIVGVWYTPCMVYLVYGILGVWYTRCMVYSVYAILCVCYTLCMLYWVYAELRVNSWSWYEQIERDDLTSCS